MAEPDRVKRAVETVKQMADRIEESLAKDGFGGYPNKPSDKDWRKGYSAACRDIEKALEE